MQSIEIYIVKEFIECGLDRLYGNDLALNYSRRKYAVRPRVSTYIDKK